MNSAYTVDGAYPEYLDNVNTADSPASNETPLWPTTPSDQAKNYSARITEHSGRFPGFATPGREEVCGITGIVNTDQSKDFMNEYG